MNGTAYEYAFKSANSSYLMALCASDKSSDAMEYCVNTLLKTKLPDDTIEQSLLRTAVGSAILEEVCGRIMSLKKSPAASAPAKA